MWLHDIKCVKFLPLKGTLFKIVELILQSRGVIKDFFFFFFPEAKLFCRGFCFADVITV